VVNMIPNEFLKPEIFFSVTIIVLSLCASLFYFVSKDYGRALYWVSAGVVNFSAIFLIK